MVSPVVLTKAVVEVATKSDVAKPPSVEASTLVSAEPSPANDAAVTVPVAVMLWLTVSAPVMVSPDLDTESAAAAMPVRLDPSP